jgi:hypothetical protein
MITSITIRVTGAEWRGGGLEYRFYLNEDNDRYMVVVKMIINLRVVQNLSNFVT